MLEKTLTDARPSRSATGRAKPFVLILALALAVAAGAAEEPSLEELVRTELPRPGVELSVSTAARLAQSADLAPAVTHVVTRQDIQRLGLRSFTDVLRRLPGFHARDEREFARVSVRGIGPGGFNGRVLFLLDGQRLNDNIYDAGQIDLDFPIDVSLIERVEFTPGPGSALYGSNALLGVVNVVTQRADRLGGAQLQAAWSPRGRQDARFSLAQRLDDGSEWLASYSLARAPALPQLWNLLQPYDAELRGLDWDDARRGQLAYRSGGLKLRALYVDRIRGLPGYQPDVDRFVQQTDQTFIRNLSAGWDGPWGGWDLSLALSMLQQRYRLDADVYADPQAQPTRDRFEALGRWGIAEARAGRNWLESHYLLMGLDWQRDLTQRFRFESVSYPTFEERASARRLGLFVQDEWALAERQRLVLGLRRDQAAGSDARWSPRLAWSWSPEPGQSLKLMWGRAFREPNRFEASTNDVLELPRPRPEQVESLELAGERALGEAWRVRASIYTLRLNRPIELDFDDGSYGNQMRQGARGLDLGVEGRWPGGWQLQFSLSALRVRDAQGRTPNFTPRAQAKWALTVPTGVDGLRLSVHGWAQSRRRGDGADVQDLPGYAVNNLHLHWQLGPQLEIFAGVQNLGGRSWVEPISTAFSDLVIARRDEQWQGGLQWRF